MPGNIHPDVAGEPVRPYDDHRLQAIALGLQPLFPDFVELAGLANQRLRPPRFGVVDGAAVTEQSSDGKRMTSISVSPRAAAAFRRFKKDWTLSGVMSTYCISLAIISYFAFSARSTAPYDCEALADSTSAI